MRQTSYMLWGVGLAALWLAGCSDTGVAEAERNERESPLYRKAFSAEQAGDIPEAVRLFNKVLIEEPRSFSAHFQLATLLHDHEEDYLGAIYHYRQYLALRPKSEKSTLAQERIRIAEQMLAPQILKKVGDSVQGISQAHLLKENERLNHLITTLEGEKSVLLEAKTKAEKEEASLKGDNDRLRDILRKMRVSETTQPDEGLSARSVGAAVREGADTASAAKTDAPTLRALRDEAETLAREGGRSTERKLLADLPSTESVLKKVEEKLAGEPAKHSAAAPEANAGGTPVKPDRSALSLFGRGEKKAQKSASGEDPRTYVVQPGDSLFRVAEKFYGDATQWKKIREANRTRIDPDGRIRAGQIIVVP